MSTSAGKLVAVVAIVIAAAGGYFAGRSTGAGPQSEAQQPAQKERRILYYRNPMGLADTSPTPKKDPMGMDYIPVYEGEADDSGNAAGQIRIGVDKVQKLGVRVEPAAYSALERVVSAVGRIEPDERRVYAVAPKFEGYVERLLVNATGQPVAKGQPLFEVYSPELVSAQREYALAAQGVESLQGAAGEVRDGMRQLAEASLARLRNWDVAEEQVKALAQSGAARRTLTLRSPVAGVVMEKKAQQGMRFMPGEMLYQVADLSSVWVIADVFEQDIGGGAVAVGAKARVSIDAYPDKTFAGRVAYVYPTLKAETRSVPVRIELANPGTLLKPGMYARVELRSAGKDRALTIPMSAVIDSGTRTIVLVQSGEDARAGRFEPRAVKLGLRSGERVEVLEGVNEGEPVVVAGNFLIDAESNLKAAIDGFGHAGQDGHSGHGKAAAAGHRASGKVEATDAKAGTVSIAHGPVAELKWPAMTMEFKVANAALLPALTPGTEVDFEFVERAPGEWVITRVVAGNAHH